MRTHDRLRIAIQKSGRLSGPARDLLAQAGFAFREDRDRLYCHGEGHPVDLLLVRDDDIPGLIADGVCDLGIVGRNVADEQAIGRARLGLPDAWRALRPLGFGRCRLALAVPEGTPWDGPAALAGRRIATSYPRLLGRWLADAGVHRSSRNARTSSGVRRASSASASSSSGAGPAAVGSLRFTALM